MRWLALLALLACGCDRGYGLLVDVDPTCLDDPTFIGVDVVFAPGGETTVSVPDPVAFLNGNHLISVVPPNGTTQITVTVTVLYHGGHDRAVGQVVADATEHQLATKKLSLVTCFDAGSEASAADLSAPTMFDQTLPIVGSFAPVSSVAFGTDTMNAVWGASASEVYIAGNAALYSLQTDGSWAEYKTGQPFRGVWGNSVGDRWAVSSLANGASPARILHWTGTDDTHATIEQGMGTFPSFAGISGWGTTACAFESQGTIWCRTASQPWSENTVAPASLNSIVMTGYEELYGAGSDGQVFHIQDFMIQPNEVWTHPSAALDQTVRSVWAIGPTFILALAGYPAVVWTSSGGDTWNQAATLGGEYNAIGGNAGHFYAVGTGGRVSFSTDGNSWSEVDTSGVSSTFNAVWVSPQNDVAYAVGNGGAVYVNQNP